MAGAIAAPVMAQSSSEQQKNAVERIQQESNGNITIDIPDQILRNILKPEETQTKKNEPELRPGINKINGFRIQVFFDGRNQNSLESRAKARGSAIVAKFPKYRGAVYTFPSGPNWCTRIGNFQSHEQASQALAEIKRAFPQYASEIRVVKSQITVIK